MDRLATYIGTRLPEIVAIIASAVTFSLGLTYAWESDPAWLNRSGSIIIVFGIFLALSRYSEWIVKRVSLDIQDNPALFFDRAIDNIERKMGLPLSEEERQSALSLIKTEYENILKEAGDELVVQEKARLKLLEIYIVIFGTLVNGFGDYAIHLLK